LWKIEPAYALNGEPQPQVDFTFGLPNLNLNDVRLEFVGGGTAEQARRIPEELPAAYPEFKMFGPLPAHGLYCRHVRSLRLRDVKLVCDKPDPRPPIVCSDVEELITGNTPPVTRAGV